jgi:hypothetical protein
MSKPKPALLAAPLLLATLAGCDRSSAQSPSDAAPVSYRAVEWTHALGATLLVPAEWEQRTGGGSTTFVPPDAARADGKRSELASFVFLTAGGIDDVRSPRVVERADAELAGLAETIHRVGEVERVDTADLEGVALHYDMESAGVRGHADLYVTLHDGLAVGLLVMGESERLARDAAIARAMFGSLRFGAELHESWIAHAWTRGEAYSSQGFSAATQTTLRLGADGRFVRVSEAAGGDASSCFESDGGGEPGRWSGGAGALVLRYDDGAIAAVSCKLVDGTLVLTDGGGRRSLWN